jgi:hypothetical protein
MVALSKEWPEGQKYRVVQDGAWLSGLKPEPGLSNAYGGWRQDLAVGDVITSLGFGPGWGSDPGYGIHFSTDQVVAEGVCYAEFKPMDGSLFNYHPKEGWLEPVVE